MRLCPSAWLAPPPYRLWATPACEAPNKKGASQNSACMRHAYRSGKPQRHNAQTRMHEIQKRGLLRHAWLCRHAAWYGSWSSKGSRSRHTSVKRQTTRAQCKTRMHEIQKRSLLRHAWLSTCSLVRLLMVEKPPVSSQIC